ncbi:hypothetical protein EDB86DRAFT_3103143 [Lactarius hatsudake]|nr:hypothetical protein EDB86DRAFT_3103143 [Lactarius hatsudake]
MLADMRRGFTPSLRSGFSAAASTRPLVPSPLAYRVSTKYAWHGNPYLNVRGPSLDYRRSAQVDAGTSRDYPANALPKTLVGRRHTQGQAQGSANSAPNFKMIWEKLSRAKRDMEEFRTKRSFYNEDGVIYTFFEHAATEATLSFVTNSGVCENTPGVDQYSGYLSVGKNMFDLMLQFKAYGDYAIRLTIPYYHPLINSSQAATYLKAYDRRYPPELNTYSSSGTDAACKKADNTYFELSTQSRAQFRQVPTSTSTISAPSGPQFKIGAQHVYKECPDAPYDKFAATGDDARTFLSTLSTVIQCGIQVLICQWTGDAADADKTPTFGPLASTRSPMHGSLSLHRPGLKHGWRAGGHLPAAIRPIFRI